MRILYGAVGEGLGHATRSRVVAAHLLEQGHRVKVAASGRAYSYLREHLPDVEEIWGTSFVLEHGTVNAWKTLTANVTGGARGVPADWRHGSEIARSFAPDLVVTDFDGFTYLFAKAHRTPVLSVDNIQMVDRCTHDAEILRGVHLDYREARTFIHAKLGRASHYVITTFFRPPLRKTRTTLVPSLLRPEILAARPERGEHLLVYGRISETAIAALEASGVPCHVYGARDGLTEEVRERNLAYKPFANEAFIDDLRAARGVVGSAGYSLMSEAVYLRKPMLALPLAGQFEQEMNARYLERLGFGTSASALDEPALERFLAREPEHERALARYEQDGNAQALATIDGLLGELAGGRR
ncbi:MAG TPA: glycosyltransferase family protein [Gaiellaceae bacterium]|nr:glycosyltransferase family protein [Gaiellaceae bacterium]